MLKVSGNASAQALESLQGHSFCLGNAARPESLWIACTDLVMDRALERVRLSESALVLREFGNTLPSEDTLPSGDADDCAETPILDHAVENLRVRDIVICGHSMCSAIPTQQREVPLQAPRVNGVDGLLQRMRHREAMNDRARDHMIRQLHALESHPSVANAISLGNLTVHGLFYLVESGVFTRYDRESGQFATIAV